jgi:hypothetical protein
VVFSVEPGALYDPDENEDSSDDTSEDVDTTDDGTDDATDASTDEIIDDSEDDSGADSSGLSSIFNPFGRDRLFDLDNYLVTEGQTDDGEGAGEFFSDIEDVNPQTIYYVRAYALLSDGTVIYGQDKEFRTEDSCFIATAAFGSIDGQGVRILRQFRDQFLTTSSFGNGIIGWYYKISPPLADIVGQSLFHRALVITLLMPVVFWAWIMINIEMAATALMAAWLLRYFNNERLRRASV